MKKVSILVLALSLVVGFTFLGVAGFEDSEMEKGLSKSPAFEGSDGHYTHKSGAPRFDIDKHGGGNIAIEPEEPGKNSSEDSAVSDHGGDSLVDTSQDDTEEGDNVEPNRHAGRKTVRDE